VESRPVPSYAVFDDLYYGQRIAVIVRWFLLAIYLGLINYRINPDNPMLLLDGIGAAVATVNVYLTWRVWKARRVPRLLPFFAGVMDLTLIADVSSGSAAVREAEFHRPDVVLMAGASGYLLKNAGRAELLNSLRAVARGEWLLDPTVAGAVLDQLRKLTASEEDREVSSLSEGEREVLALVARGQTNKQIAATLIISEHTALNHVSHILDKLDLTRRSEAASFVAQHGLVDDSDALTPSP
jgi:DNA-binding CsgD family transcriptional regulator